MSKSSTKEGMAKRLLELAKSELVGANDDLYRATMSFGRMTPDQLDQQYGESGKTGGQILTEYQQFKAEAEELVAYAKGLT